MIWKGLRHSVILKVESVAESVISNIELGDRSVETVGDVSDIELRDKLNRLQFAVNGNFILIKYYVIEGFRLVYFPFAVDYLETYNIPTTPWACSNLDDIISASTSNLKSLIESIDSIKNNNDEIVII